MQLRKATMADADFLLELKNDPVMRRFAVVTHAKIKKENHLKWLTEHLDEINIVMEEERIGMFRIATDREVSINLHPNFRGKGYGQKIMQFCPKGVWAKIVAENIASLNLFMTNGFKIIRYTDGLFYLEN